MKTTFKPENVIEILDENTASCAKVYCVLTKVLKTVDIRSPKTVVSVHFSSSKPMAMQIY